MRVRRVIDNSLIRIKHAIYLRLRLKRGELKFLTTKSGKSVYQANDGYIYCYEQACWVDKLMELSTSCRPAFTRLDRLIVACEEVHDLGASGGDFDVDSFVSEYWSPVREFSLAEWGERASSGLKTDAATGNLKRIFDAAASSVGPEFVFKAGLCHGDLRREHIGRIGARYVAIDWDDGFLFCKEYDATYFRLQESVARRGEPVSYMALMRELNLIGPEFNMPKYLASMLRISPMLGEQQAVLFVVPFLIRAARESVQALEVIEGYRDVISLSSV